MLGATLLGAACDNTTTPVVVTPVTLNLLPDAATLNIGQTLAMTVVVTNSTNQAASFVSSNPAAATVNATTGLVTAVAAGITVITATSAADANAKDASTITVNPAAPVPTPSISISKITTGNLQTPINPANVSGQIDVTLNVSVPTGAQVQRVETLVDGTVVCTQGFTSSGSITVDQDETDAADEIVCAIFTNTFDATTGAVAAINKNGPHTISARLVQPNGNTIATPSTPLIYNNMNLVIASITASKAGVAAGSNARSLAGAGSLWNGGDVTVTMLGVNFGGASDALATASATIETSGVGVSGVSG
jgi:nitrite reductase/ring-hydroxylating ferredoxin subunit